MGASAKSVNANVRSRLSLSWSILATCLLLLMPPTDRRGLSLDMRQLPGEPGQWQWRWRWGLEWEGVAAVQGQYVTASDASALREIQTSLGRTFNGWTGSLIDCLSAEHVQCDNAGNVLQLVLCSQALVGTIPSAIGRLTSLTFLCLKDNGFFGEIPTSFSNLGNLVTLRLANNRLYGQIPDGFSTLVQLQYLNLAYNMLYDSIPSSLGSLPYLSYLDLKSNMVTSTIPDSFQNLQNLNFLSLAKNQLSGTVPWSLSRLASLKVLYISENQLSGSLPSEIGNLQQLTLLAVAINQLQSTIPNSLSMLTELHALDLSYNQFEGRVPEWLGRLTQLTYLNFARNQLTGTVPTTLMALTALTFLGGDPTLFCPANGGPCPLKQAGYESLQYCKACTDFCRTCVAGTIMSPSPPPRRTPPQKPPPPRNPPPRNPPPRKSPPPPPPPPPRSSPPPPRPPPRSPSPPPPRPPPPPRYPPPSRSPPPVRSPPLKPPPPVAKPLPPAKSPPRLPPPSIKPSPPSAKQAPPPPFKSPPLVSKKPPPPKRSPPVPPGTGLSFGFAPALSFTPRFLNGQVFRHASVNYSYDSRRNWRIDSSTDWTTDNNALGQAIALPVKEQGPCAACWAMAPVSAVSAGAAIVFNTLDFGFVPDLSVQQVISCGSSLGCDGGLPSVAFDYIANFSSVGQQAGGGLQGLFTENNYKYTTTNATCQLPTCRTCKPTQYGITMYEQADFYGWFGLLLTLQQQPAVVTLYAACTAFLSYKIGILDSAEAAACDSVPNHALVAVGYVLNAGVPYWVLQNSWGTQWGEGGRVRIAITGGFGLFNMHLMPALYPVITTSNPCRDPINPCGSGTCVPNGDGSNRCECRDPFVSVTNIDGRTQSCVPKAVCAFFLFNPCSVGTCVEDGLGGYSCVCPLGFVDGERSTDGAKTCVPSSAIGSQKYRVSVAGLTCSVIAASFGLTVDQLLQQNSNPPLVCDDGGVAVGTVVDVSHPATQAACNVLYTWNQGDNCVMVAQRFSLAGGYADLETLNPWLRCSMSPPAQPGMQVCVRRGDTPTSLPNCTNYYTAQKGDTCESIRTKFQLDAFAFYALNPGIYCDRLQLAALDLLASGQQVCVSAEAASFRLCQTGSKPRSVVRGDTCLGLLARFFGSLQQMVALNYGFRCAPRQLFVGKIICIPASPSGGRPPPPVPKKARQMCDTSTSGGEMIRYPS